MCYLIPLKEYKMLKQLEVTFENIEVGDTLVCNENSIKDGLVTGQECIVEKVHESDDTKNFLITVSTSDCNLVTCLNTRFTHIEG